MLHPEFAPLHVAQIWGYVRYPLVIAMYASRRDWVLRLCGTLACACGAVHFWLLGVVTAALSALLQGTRILMPPVSGDEPLRRRQLLALAYGAGFLALAVASWQGWISLLAATLSWASTCAFLLLRDRGLRTRLLQLELCWLAFGFLSHSHSQVLISLTVIPIQAWRVWSMSRPPLAGAAAGPQTQAA